MSGSSNNSSAACLIMETEDDIRWALLDKKVKAERLVTAVRHLRNHGIDPIVIKGWAVARKYPKDILRTYADIDLAVSPDSFSQVRDLLRTDEFRGFGIDPHSGLRTLDTLSWNEIFDRSILVELNGENIRVLSDEDNLRVTAIHWLLDGGVFRKRLTDVKYLAENGGGDLDWDRCIYATGPVRASWVLSALAAARDHENLDTLTLPPAVREVQLPEWFQHTLEKEWKRGPYTRIPIRLCLTKPGRLFEQISRRIPPNPIASTIITGSPIDSSSRFPIQMKRLFVRVLGK